MSIVGTRPPLISETNLYEPRHKVTIAFLESFLEYLNVNNSLKQFLSSMSVYAIPTMEEIYETA